MACDIDIDPTQSGPLSDHGSPPTGKAKQFLRLFLRNQRRLYAYVLTLLPNRSDADDVFQEASLVMWDKFDDAHPPDDFTAWGCRIAYFKVLDFRKKHQRGRVLFSQAMLDRLAESALEQSAALQLDDRREALTGCLEKLPRRDRDLLVQRLADGATVRSTAAHIGRSADAVYKALARIRRGLFDCVTRTLAREARS
jgi:RNA polymerase sigma-70 factor, ECF subfamily